MKNKLLNAFRRAVSAGALALMAGLVPAQAQTSPVGTWDCLLNGQRQGTAYIQFSGNGTFIIQEVMVPNAPKNTSNNNGNGGRTTGDGGRGVTPPPNPFVPNQQIFGDETTSGFWAIDAKGRLIGFFVETSQQIHCTDTLIPISTNITVDTFPSVTTNTTDTGVCIKTPTATNDLGGGSFNYTEMTVCSTNVIVCSALTNTISFVGKVTPTRLTLHCSTTFGDTSYEGVPFQQLPDITGTYSGLRKQAGVTYQEFLTFANLGGNIYSNNVQGPGYTYNGISILSSQKRISFSLGQSPAIPTNPPTVIRAVTGPFNPKNNSANTRGWDQESGPLANPETFKVTLLPVP